MLTKKEIQTKKEEIDKLSQTELASLHRFAPSGHPYFDMSNVGLYDHFVKRFEEKGGMTLEISKSIGW